MAKELNPNKTDLESYVLVLPTISKFAKHFNVTFNEMQAILFEQEVTPGQINSERYYKLKKKLPTEEIAKYYQVATSTLYRACKQQNLNKPLTDVSRKQVLKLIFEGMSAQKLAEHYNVCYSTMLSFLKENNLQPKRQSKLKISSKQVKNLYKQGISKKELAERFGCTIQCIDYHLNK